MYNRNIIFYHRVMFKFFEKPPVDEPSEDDVPQPGELPEAIIQDFKGDWSTERAVVAEEHAYEKRIDEYDLEAVGGDETAEERQREAENEANYISPESTGFTLHDKQIADAEFGKAPSLIDVSGKHDEIVEKFDKETDEQGIRYMKDVLWSDGARARGGNSKPIEKDYKGGESIRNDISI